MEEATNMPASIDCWACGTYMTLDEHSENDGYCPECNAEIDLDPYLAKALAGYAVRDARIAELEEEVKTSAECLDMANDLYSTFKRENDQLRAELADAKETITRYEVTAENCDVLRAELTAIKAQEPVAWANPEDLVGDGYGHSFGVSSSEYLGRVPLYAAQVAKQGAKDE